MDNVLRKLNGDKTTKEAFKEYLTSVVAQVGVGLMFEKKDVSHIADAKMLIDKAFEQLEIDYAIPEQTPEQSNPAR